MKTELELLLDIAESLDNLSKLSSSHSRLFETLTKAIVSQGKAIKELQAWVSASESKQAEMTSHFQSEGKDVSF